MKNRKKPQYILTLLIFSLTFLFSIGLAIWIITDTIIVKPSETDQTNQIIIEYLDKQDGTYNGNILLPSNTAFGLDINSERLTYSYKKENSDGTYPAEFTEVDLENKSGPIDAGNYKIKVSFVNYDNPETPIEQELDFVVIPRSIEDAEVVFDREDGNVFYVGHTYDDFVENMKVSIVLVENAQATPLLIDKDFTLNAPELTIINNSKSTKIVGINNFEGELTIIYDVKPPELVAIVATNENFVLQGSSYLTIFTGKEIPLSVTVEDSLGTEIAGASVSYSYTIRGKNEYLSGLPIDYQYYTIQIAMSAPDYENKTTSIDVFVNSASLENVEISVSGNYVYNAGEIKPGSSALSATFGDYGTLEYGTDYIINGYSNNIDAGTAIIKITYGSGKNFSGSTTCEFTINKATPVITLPSYKYVKQYNGNNRGWYIEGMTPILSVNGNAKFENYENNMVLVEGTLASNASTRTFTEGDNAINEVAIQYTFVPSDVKNFNQATADDYLVMLATGYSTTTSKYYGTVEKAIAVTTGKTYVLSQIYELTGFYPTITNKNDLNPDDDFDPNIINVANGASLILPYGISLTETTDSEGKLKITYENFVDSFITGDQKSYDTSSKVTTKPSFLIIEDDITMNFNGTSQLIVGSFIQASGLSAFANSSMILNEGTINMNGTSKVTAHGFIKGKGEFKLNSGTKCYDLLTMYDFPGARYAAGMYYEYYHGRSSSKMKYNNIMPFQTYSFHNISCQLYLYYGAEYYATTQINVSNTIYSRDVLMFGNSSSSALFKMQGSGGHIYRTVENYDGSDSLNTSFLESNQLASQKEVYKFNSNIIDGSITVSMTIVAVDITITSSTSLAMPIGMMDITICNGYTLTINQNSYKFFPGSKVTIEEGGTLNIANSSANVIFYSDYIDDYTKNGSKPSPEAYQVKHSFLYNSDKTAVIPEYASKLIVNGTLTATGKVGGVILTTGTTGKITLSSNSASLNKLTSISELSNSQATSAAATLVDFFGWGSAVHFNGTVKTDTQSPKLYLQNGTAISTTLSNASTGTYVAVTDGAGNYGWVKN